MNSDDSIPTGPDPEVRFLNSVGRFMWDKAFNLLNFHAAKYYPFCIKSYTAYLYRSMPFAYNWASYFRQYNIVLTYFISILFKGNNVIFILE